MRSARKGGIYLNDKTRKLGIVIAVILGVAALLYLGGMLSQLLSNYAHWMETGGMTGQTTMPPVNWNPLICLSLIHIL